MTHRSRTALVTLAVLATAACAKDKSATPADTGASAPATAASAPAASGGDAEIADVTRYELSMDKIDRYLAAQRNIALKMKAMSPAEREAVKARGENRDDTNASLDDIARNIESEPVMRDAIREAGLSSREFAVLTISMMQTAMASSVLKMRPNDNQDSLVREMKANPENIKFYREHEAEITRKSNELKAEMQRLGVSEEQ